MARDMVRVQRPETNLFREMPSAQIGRSQFNRSHGLKTTFDASYLYPILVDEVMPGDTFTCKLNGFARIFSPLDAPVMDNIEVETFFFFVPTRLLWEHWVDMMGEHDGPGAQDTTYSVPQLATGMVVNHDAQHSAHDVHFLGAYMGLPHGVDSNLTGISAMPFRAYNQIYNEWFRDQNILGEVLEHKTDASDTPSSYAIRKSAKKHDYFTSSLPYRQKGAAQTTGLQGIVDVRTSAADDADLGIWSTVAGAYREMDTNDPTLDLSSAVPSAGDKMFVDLNVAGASVDINALRRSIMIQRILERDARGGTRYTEIIKSHFGVTSPDFRLQRPEYLGGGKSYITVAPVANTSDTVGAAQGELRGVGSGVISGHGWAKSFTEHGYVIGLIRARGDLTYFQGVSKMWTREVRYDFYIPAFAHLGELATLNGEIWASNNTAIDFGVFGYQEAWAFYRMKLSGLTGNFNPDVAGSLSFWHLAEDFGSLPTLNAAFIEDQTPMQRVTTVTTEPDFIADLWFDYKCARPMPVRSIPSLTSGIL